MRSTRASQRRKKQMFAHYVIFLLVWTISIFLMYIASMYKDATKVPTLIAGGVFWIGLIGTLGSARKINNTRKNSYIFKKENSRIKQFGLIFFFKNKEATVADIAMIVSLLGFAAVRIYADSLFLLFFFLAVFVFSFGMHCLLNGKNYIYLKYKVRREDEL